MRGRELDCKYVDLELCAGLLFWYRGEVVFCSNVFSRRLLGL